MKGMGDLWAGLVLAAMLAFSTPAFAVELGVPAAAQKAALVHQSQERWCWAASMEMVLRCHGLEVPQREIVKRIYGAILGGARDHGGSTQDIVHALDSWSADERGRPFHAVINFFDGRPSPELLRSELSAGRPLLLGLNVGYHLRHAVVLAAGQCTIWPSGPKFYEFSVLDPEAYGPRRLGADETLGPVWGFWTVNISQPATAH